jgi:geranyl-CoA carboxylase alpha subunit
MSFGTILIANRGEIAVRIARTARRLGYRTVAVYSEADRGAPHVAAADQAVCIGPPPVRESYLSVERLLDAAKRTGADAVHPGYGFLSENAAFASACAEAGLVFIGPPPAAIDSMGNKARAKRLMLDAGVPCVPGYQGDDPSDEAFERAARELGYPVMVKAAAGGGGRGMRLVSNPADLPSALASARHEAANAFGSGELLLEKAVVAPRHVEIQVVADRHGNVIHLGERDCSVQRRHQKVLEESPSPAVGPELREAMGAAAVAAARACGYEGAGTVEMLLGGDGAFYFLEMNTRLQVEHPVTELVTGLDLVEWQLRIARGEPLPLSQADVALSGHAIEARLYAEDPAHEYLPQTGTILRWEPRGDVRFDHGVTEGFTISPHYDPMIAKVIAHGPTRADALRKLASSLRSTTLFGLTTNKSFLAAICEDPAFAKGLATTAFLEREFDGHPTRRPSEPSPHAFALAALVSTLETARGSVPDASFIGWRSGGPVDSIVVLASGGVTRELSVAALGAGALGQRYRVTCGESFELEVADDQRERLAVILDGVRREVRHHTSGTALWTDDGEHTLRFEDVTYAPVRRDASGSGTLMAPLDGKVIDVRVTTGDRVARGQVLVVVEAMKMEHRIEADVTGEVLRVAVERGQQVKIRQLLVAITPDATEAT